MKTAHWSCPRCRIDYCPDCVDKRPKNSAHGGEMLYMCPKCIRPAQFKGIANLIQPFWQRLHNFFTYALYPRPLLLSSVLCVIAWILSSLPLIGWLAGLFTGAVFLNYAFAALKATAQGRLTPPRINLDEIQNNFGQVIKQGLMYTVLFIVMIAIAAKGGRVPTLIYLVVVLFCLPAMIMIVVVTDELGKALNPFAVIQVVFQIGWSYLLMYLFLMLLLGAPAALGYTVIQHLPPILQPLLRAIAQNTYMLISYHLMGYVILQYHDNLGFPVDLDTFEESFITSAQGAAGKAAQPADPILEEVNRLAREGRMDEAIQLVQEETAKDGITDLTLSEKYFNLLKIRKQIPALLKHAPVHLRLLAQQNQRTKACEIYTACLARDPQFKPTATTMFKLGGWLLEMGKAKQAVATYNRMVTAYPDSPLVPKAYFRAAQIFNDRLMDSNRARKILGGVLKKYPDHEIAPQIKNYMAHMGA